MSLVSYIHLNPVKAGIVKFAKDYHWSGHATYLGLDNFQWLTTDWMLSQLSTTHPRQAYAEFVKESSAANNLALPENIKEIVDVTIEEMNTHNLNFNDIVKFVYQIYEALPYEINPKNSKINLKTKAIIAWLSSEL